MILTLISEPEVTVLGGPDMFVETGSVINMTCSVAWTPAPPASTSWRHNNSLISFRGPRPGVSIIIDKGEITTAQLLIMSARSEIMMVTIIADVFSFRVSQISDLATPECTPVCRVTPRLPMSPFTCSRVIYGFAFSRWVAKSGSPGAWHLCWNKTNNFNRYK